MAATASSVTPGLTGTATIPARISPTSTSTTDSELPISTQARSPGFSPRAERPAPTWLDRAISSAQVRAPSQLSTAGRPARQRPCRAQTSGISGAGLAKASMVGAP